MNLKKHYLCSAFAALISIGAYAQKDYTTAPSGLKYKFLKFYFLKPFICYSNLDKSRQGKLKFQHIIIK